MKVVVGIFAAAVLLGNAVTSVKAGIADQWRPKEDLLHDACKPSKTNPFDKNGNVCGEPLDLTTVMKADGRMKARDDARVNIGNITSYSGFFETQSEPAKNHMFWWYFPSQSGDKNAPLLIWLQGGPGGSSLFGLFAEMGPLELDANLHVKLRDSSWNKQYAMLFIDNPVGAGFSYPESDAGYCNNTKECVASNLYSLLQQFYQMFPEQMENPLFITGESYGGHYVPAISYYIHEHNIGNRKCRSPHHSPCAVLPFAGMAIGDGWIDPVNQMTGYPGLLYNIGMVDDRERAKFQDYCDSTISLIKQNRMVEAFEVWDEMLNGDVYPYTSYFTNVTGSSNYDNWNRIVAPECFSYYAKYVNLPEVRAQIHVGNAKFNSGSECEKHLLGDFHVSLADELVTLLEYGKYRIFLYSGQLDIIIGSALTEAFLKVLPWSGLKQYLTSEKIIWKLQPTDEDVAGYVKSVGNFSYAIVRGAGHISPYDQPERMLDLIHKLVDGKPFAKEISARGPKTSEV